MSPCSTPPIATFLRDFVNPFGEWSALLTPSCVSDDARNSKHERLHRCRLVHQGGSCRLDPFPSCRPNSKPALFLQTSLDLICSPARCDAAQELQLMCQPQIIEISKNRCDRAAKI